MRVHNDFDSFIPAGSPVVSLGIFDGVHLGHRELIDRVAGLAARYREESLLITFWPHPRVVLGRVDEHFRLLTTLGEKISLLKECGIDHLLVIPFTPDFAEIPAESFLAYFFKNRIKPVAVVAGDDVRFGAGAAGDRELLVTTGREAGFEVDILPPRMDSGARISSTRIRSLLLAGDLSSANRLLGHPYMITAQVGPGKQIGRSIGFPTANLECCEGLKQIPCDGVYAVQVQTNGTRYRGMLNIGIRPTLADHPNRTIEVHLFDVEKDLYGEMLTVSFIARLRDEMKFGSLEELKQQLAIDRVAALEALGNG